MSGREKKAVKVLQVINGLNFGGAEKVVADLATQVDQAQFETAVCCVRGTKGVLAERLEEQGVPVVVPAEAGSLLALKRIIREQQPDVIHSHGTAALLHMGPLKLLGGMPPIVHTFHFGNYPHVKRRYLYMERLFARTAEQLVAVADQQRRTIIEWHKVRPSSITTILNGVDGNPHVGDQALRERKRAEFGFRSDDVVLGCVAVLSEQKGVSYLLEAAQVLLAENPRLKVFIAGGGPLKDALEQRSAELGISDRVLFAGWRKDVLELLPMMDLFVMPSLWEAFSMVLLEAMAAHCPIIATDVGDNGSVIADGDNGILIPPRNSQAIVDAVRRLAPDLQRARAMGERAYAYYREHLTVKQMAQNYERVYSELAGVPLRVGSGASGASLLRSAVGKGVEGR